MSGDGEPRPVERTTSRPARWRRSPAGLWGVGLLGAVLVGLPALGAWALVAGFDAWYPPLAGLGSPQGQLVLLGAGAVLAGLSLVPTHAVSLVAGMLAGPVAGSLLAVTTVALAAALGHGLLRRVVGRCVLEAVAARPRAAVVHRALLAHRSRLVGIIVLLRLSPVMPFAGSNLLFAALGVAPGPFLAGSVVGLAPRVVLVAVAGAGLAELDLSRTADMRLALIGGAATLASLFVLGRLGRRALDEALRAG